MCEIRQAIDDADHHLTRAGLGAEAGADACEWIVGGLKYTHDV